MKKIECVIMDWAGTTIDFGCFAPVAAFIGSFKAIGIDITTEEARRPMGLTKIDHIRALFEMERIGRMFAQKYGRNYEQNDIDARYADFQKLLFATLSNYTDPIPRVVETIARLREKGIKIGSTTGYTSEMMKTVVPAAAQKGYMVDCYVTSDGLPGGRPNPYMIYQNQCRLAVASPFSAVKFGDTIADIKEGLNAGVWTVGVVIGSNELGLTEAEVKAMPEEELKERKRVVRNRMYAAGAHYVVDTILELPDLIEAINQRMANG